MMQDHAAYYQPTQADWEEYFAYVDGLEPEPPIPHCDNPDACPVCYRERESHLYTLSAYQDQLHRMNAMVPVPDTDAPF